MNILIVTDPAGENPFFKELIHELEQYVDISITINLDEFWNPTKDYDIVHLQWPEELFLWKVPDDNQLTIYKECLDKWKKNAKIIWTVHNASPHDYDNLTGHNMYSFLIERCDVILHLEKSSVGIIKELYRHTISNQTEHTIIPHGMFESYENKVTRQQARQYFGFREKDFVILIFGRVRKESEKQLIFKINKLTKIRNKKILISNWTYNEVPRNLRRIRKLFFLLSGRYKVGQKFVKKNEIQYYFNAADILLIPRVESLNSGILLLGFYFSKVVVGPGVGNIKDILEKTKNPIYNPDNEKSIINAIKEAMRLSQESRKGQENFEYAINELSWKKIAPQYYNLYKSVIQ